MLRVLSEVKLCHIQTTNIKAPPPKKKTMKIAKGGRTSHLVH